MESKKITVQVTVHATIDKVWELWTSPTYIVQWNNASDDWHTTKAINDLKVAGKFLYRMEAKDGSEGFDFWGIYNNIITNELIEYTMGDGRNALIVFEPQGPQTTIIQTFEAETENSIELQQFGWQSIMNNFKQFAEKI
jgi:uncharacterized protein YndB with AHSA1/START domain